ncbi:DUF1802 family protein [Pseudanabaena sp. FACHB-1277]|uniref:DUF1802 family protein n=1 Tax=Pseudanabaena cinerea FACHB-1277 TaxID=2949581 RepID=A0A926USN6_9CYAN|nr:DUF1802 family protein [Pseudanabaena cinerea]MBD2149592.1 DUF1802 family protein [Pseudanabaena cinerea FACHB-1277]
MTEATIFAALRLPSGVLSSLESGSITAIHAQSFNRPQQSFALCSDDPSASEVKISAWARCDGSQQFSEKNKCDILAARLQIPAESLQNALEQNDFIWLSYLRVYHLPSPIIIKNSTKGVFLALEDRVYINDLQPVLDDITYEKRKREVENLEPPEPLDVQIQRMIEEAELQQKIETSKNLDWIQKIAKVGNSSGGHEFEKLVRKSFIFLGFSNSNTNPKASLDPEATGGAGGIDLCCELPYPVVGECKASANQKIPTEVCSQLTYLGQAHFPNHYEKAVKIIIAAGSLNHHSNPVAIGNKMNVIRPETLEELVKLKLTHSGAINLQDLKLSLESEPFGEDSNSKILGFIEKAKLEIKLRSHIVNLVKKANKKVGIDYLSGVFDASNYPKHLEDNELSDILIELSSPLAGYLGRVKGDGGTGDRFYYLRDLPS